MRQKATDEQETRKAIQNAIDANMNQSCKVYPSPSRLQSILKADGIRITRPTLYRAYEQLGIRSVEGMWIKDV